MYLSEEMTLIGWALYFGSPSLSAWVAAMAAAMRFAVGREEKTLEDRFGEAWKEYAAAVPRWL